MSKTKGCELYSPGVHMLQPLLSGESSFAQGLGGSALVSCTRALKALLGHIWSTHNFLHIKPVIRSILKARVNNFTSWKRAKTVPDTIPAQY